MDLLKFDVYVGTAMVLGQSPKIKAVVVPKFVIPHGKYKVDGTDVTPSVDCFINLYDLNTYFEDWFDLCKNDNFICATIFYGTLSNKKSLKGRAIVDYIDELV